MNAQQRATALKDLGMPEGLSNDGKKAWEVIHKFLMEQDPDTYTGGCRAFYSPEQWKARKEQYGTTGVLVVVYDGGDVGQYFGLDHECYVLHEAMRQALHKAGFWAEECTCWYSAIYMDRKPGTCCH